MAHLITFSTSDFDASKEEPNPINPIAGQALLVWLRAKLEAAGCAVTVPSAEDWGWYVDVEHSGASYLLGASGDAEARAAEDVEWAIQIDRHRTLRDRLMGRNRLPADDPLSSLVERIVRAEPGFRDVTVDRGA